MRFRRPDEVLAGILFESGARLEVAYASQPDLRSAYEKEFRHGYVFIPTEIRVDRGSHVVVAIRLDFANKVFEFDASVVQVSASRSSITSPSSLARALEMNLECVLKFA